MLKGMGAKPPHYDAIHSNAQCRELQGNGERAGSRNEVAGCHEAKRGEYRRPEDAELPVKDISHADVEQEKSKSRYCQRKEVE